MHRLLTTLLLLAATACSSGTADLEEEPGGLPVESQVHTVTVTVDCDGNCKSGDAGTTQRTFSCTHGEPLRLLVAPQGRGGEGSTAVSVTVSIDGAVVATGSKAIVVGDPNPLTVRAICE